jgi:broad specificity phosphatase PhoE
MFAGNRRILKFASAFLFLLAIMHAPAAPASEAVWALLKQPGHFAFLRHANAPGTLVDLLVDVSNCALQRNLDEVGRAQARRIGEEFRRRGIRAARLVSSQYCRCLETAKLMALGPVAPFPALNYLDSHNEEAMRARTAEVMRLIESAPPGPPVVLVSHISNITAATDVVPKSGEMIVVRFDPPARLVVVGRIPPPK